MPTENVITAIQRAELILLSSGSLYTSIIPNLLVKGVSDAIYQAKAPTIYICNIMTQPGETVGYRASDHVHAIEPVSYTHLLSLSDCKSGTRRSSQQMKEKLGKKQAAYAAEMEG